MSRIEDLPTDMDKLLDLASKQAPPPTTSTATATPAPDLPPAMAATKQYSTAELLAELNRSPLFMTTLDDDNNTDLEALKALAYEGTTAEVAGNFREQGNECARAKRWVDAREFYDKAVTVLRHGVPKQGVVEADKEAAEVDWLDRKKEDGDVEGVIGEEEVDPAEEARKEKELEEACFVNRALCNLELKNYGSCTKDCAAALRLNPNNIKALYRSSQALFQLQKLDLAKQACSLLLTMDASNASAQAHLKKINAAITYSETVRRQAEARETRKRTEKATLAVAIKARGWAMRYTKDKPVDAEDAEIKLDDVLDPTSYISVPVLLLYPTAAQSELIKGIHEQETVGEHLDYILPDTPWDEVGEFKKPEDVECYMETREGGLIKLGRKVKLGKVLGGGKVEILDGLCTIFVVPKAKVSGWIEEFKRRKGTA